MRRGSIGLLLSIALGCTTAVPAPEPSATEPTAPPPPAQTALRDRSASMREEPPRGSWSDLVKSGRNSMRFNDTPQAEQDFTAAYALTREFRPSDPRTVTTIRNLQRVARSYLRDGLSPDFIRVMDLLVSISDEVESARTAELAGLLADLAHTRTLEGRPEEAVPALERAIAITVEQGGERDPALAGLRSQLGLTYLELGQPSDARRHIDLAVEVADAVAGAESPLYGNALLARAKLHYAELQPDRAEEDMLAAVGIYVETYGEDHEATARVVRELALFYAEAGRVREAEAQYDRVVSIWDAIPNEIYQRAQSRNDLAWFLVESGEPGRAEAPARSAIEMLDHAEIGSQPRAAVADTLATALRDQGKYEDAEIYYREALAGGAEADGLPGWDVSEIAGRYAELLRETGRDAEADALLASGGATD